MLKPSHIILLLMGGLLLLFVWHYQKLQDSLSHTRFNAAASGVKYATHEPLIPLPQNLSLDAQKVALGDKLFHDPRLSGDNTVACANCHNLQAGGTDRLRFSMGVNGAVGPINSPTVFNSGFNFRQFWDGRAATLEEQIEGPLHAEAEMASNWSLAISRLKQDKHYLKTFNQLYPDGITSENIKNAIAIFERSLITPNSPFDRYLRGETQALTEEEKEGYRRFKAYGCVSCHQGINIGGNMYQIFGALGSYFEDRGDIKEVDLGRFNVTGNPQDKYVFKVPSLRNIAVTAPYFHDGSAQTLEQAVVIMGHYQLGRHLGAEDVRLLVAFLHTLTGEYRGQPL